MYVPPKLSAFSNSKTEKETIKIISKELKRVKPPHYGGPGILICEGHVGESTYG